MATTKLGGGYTVEVESNMTARGIFHHGTLYHNGQEVIEQTGWHTPKSAVLAWARAMRDMHKAGLAHQRKQGGKR